MKGIARQCVQDFMRLTEMPVLHQRWEKSRRLWEGTLPLHGPRALIVRIEECNYQSATQSLDRDQEIGSEIFTMFGQEMSLNVTRTSPLEGAKQAVAPLLVYVLPMPCELLCTPKALVAVGTDTLRLAVHLTSVLNSHMLSCSKGPSLGCNNLCLDHRTGNLATLTLYVGKLGSSWGTDWMQAVNAPISA